MHTPPLRGALLWSCLALLAGAVQAASVTCQSRNMQREDCTLNGRGEVTLARQISKTPCVKGRNWDETRQGLYVTEGCGGVFESRGGWGGGPGQGSGWSGANIGDHGDLAGVRVASGDAELRRRGLQRTRDEPAPGGRIVFWRTPARGCVEVRVVDGRYQTVRAVGRGACEGGRPPPDRPMPGDGHPLGPHAASACLMQNSGDGAGSGDVASQNRISPGVWELVINFPNGRFLCRINDRGQVISFNRG